MAGFQGGELGFYWFGSLVLGKDTFEVTVSPKVALVVILYEINKDDDDDLYMQFHLCFLITIKEIMK